MKLNWGKNKLFQKADDLKKTVEAEIAAKVKEMAEAKEKIIAAKKAEKDDLLKEKEAAEAAAQEAQKRLIKSDRLLVEAKEEMLLLQKENLELHGRKSTEETERKYAEAENRISELNRQLFEAEEEISRLQETQKKPDESSDSEQLQFLQKENLKLKEQTGKAAENKETTAKNFIEIAMADGVFSPNEEKILILKLHDLGYKLSDFEDFKQKLLNENSPEARLIDPNQQKGENFEKLIVSKFTKIFFKLKNWRGDKFHKGNYASETKGPDLVYSYKMKGKEGSFAVECKYRSRSVIQNGERGIQWAERHKLLEYQEFAKKEKMPVFVALGSGGTSEEPKYGYIFPINYLAPDDYFLSLKRLDEFKIRGFAACNFGFDVEKLTVYARKPKDVKKA